MPDKNIEKLFLYLTLLSLLLHVAVFGVISLIPPEPRLKGEETTVVELNDLPALPPSVKSNQAPKTEPRRPARTARVPLLKSPVLPPEKASVARKEAATRAEHENEKVPQGGNSPNLSGKTETSTHQVKTDTPERGGKETPRGEGIFKPQRGSQNDMAKFFPSARRLKHIEEGFRKQYLDVERGDTRLMDTDDPDIGGFSRRFVTFVAQRLNAIDPFINKGVGVTILNITFKRDGTIEGIRIVNSTGNKAIEALAIEASRTASFAGPLPRRWPYDVLNLVCAFSVQEGLVTTGWESR